MSLADYAAFWILPFVSVATLRHSRIVAAACALAFFASIAYLDTGWDPLRWGTAVATGLMGVFALGRIVAKASSARAVLCRPAWLAALLAGSACADIVSLHYESMGHKWGALPIWQIIVCFVMIAIARTGRE